MRLLDARPRLCLVLFCLLCWLPGFFTLPPSDRDESRFAQATKQMLETGDFVRIREGEQARNKKPVGIYWLQAPFAAAFGRERIWAYRMPSLLGALAAVLLTHAIGLRLASRRAALLAGAMLGGSVLLAVEAHMAKTDAVLLAATAAAMLVLARAYLDPGGIPPRLAAGFWLAVGAGVLVKGPVTPMVAGLAAGALALWDRRRGRAGWLRALRPGWGVPLLLAAVLPWFVAIGVATHGQFFAESVGGDLGDKIASGVESHWGPPGLHAALVPLLLFPGSALVIPGVAAGWRDRANPGVRFLLAWLVPAWLVFELVPTKLPHYPLPLYPALCLLGARWAVDGRAAPRWLARLGRGLALAAAAVLGAGAVALPVFLHASPWLGIPGLAAAGLAAWVLWRRGAAVALVAMPLVYGAVLGWELPRVPALWLSPRAVAAAVAAGPGTALGSVGYAEPSLRFLAGTDIRFLAGGAAGAQALASGQVGRLLVGDRDLAQFRAEAARLGLDARESGVIRGYNYSRGRWVTLTLFVR